MYNRHNDGWIEVITGCMFAGKTEEFIRRIMRLQFARKEVLIIKPSIDTRYYANKVVSHRGLTMTAFAISKDKPEAIFDLLEQKQHQKVTAIAVDEVQFFNERIIKILNQLADQNFLIIAAGLDQDFRGEAFPVMCQLLPIAEFVTKLDAVCVKCGAAATRTQRIVNDQPAKYDDPIIDIGAKDKYEARCRKHHEILK